jgi:Domain of unknown function (DUF4258)
MGDKDTPSGRMKLIVATIEPHARGKVYKVIADGKAVSILLTFHALERITQWRLSVQGVLETLLFPEEVVQGHRRRSIAHRRARRHVVRAVYEYEGAVPVVITVYYPSAKRYFQGGGTYEDRILP